MPRNTLSIDGRNGPGANLPQRIGVDEFRKRIGALPAGTLVTTIPPHVDYRPPTAAFVYPDAPAKAVRSTAGRAASKAPRRKPKPTPALRPVPVGVTIAIDPGEHAAIATVYEGTRTEVRRVNGNDAKAVRKALDDAIARAPVWPVALVIERQFFGRTPNTETLRTLSMAAARWMQEWECRVVPEHWQYLPVAWVWPAQWRAKFPKTTAPLIAAHATGRSDLSDDEVSAVCMALWGAGPGAGKVWIEEIPKTGEIGRRWPREARS